ncbi:hypothetical protein F2Q69_00040936 [Brassica cretica]|uniref:Uncharacterized protein n=1 Tax=Brassica cretica TaxID=69181 RepID=A0A8S9NHL0_BRACR|nr:hypothetical protein F2Q69_00040936 [Brassica cretica]
MSRFNESSACPADRDGEDKVQYGKIGHLAMVPAKAPFRMHVGRSSTLSGQSGQPLLSWARISFRSLVLVDRPAGELPVRKIHNSFLREDFHVIPSLSESFVAGLDNKASPNLRLLGTVNAFISQRLNMSFRDTQNKN